MPGAPSRFLLLVRPGAPSSVLVKQNMSPSRAAWNRSARLEPHETCGLVQLSLGLFSVDVTRRTVPQWNPWTPADPTLSHSWPGADSPRWSKFPKSDTCRERITSIGHLRHMPNALKSGTRFRVFDHRLLQVTGSNSVNVYLGIGIPWLAAALYWASGVARLQRLQNENGLEMGWGKRGRAHDEDTTPIPNPQVTSNVI